MFQIYTFLAVRMITQVTTASEGSSVSQSWGRAIRK